MNPKSDTIEPPPASLVAEIPCELVRLEQADGFLGWARWFAAGGQAGSTPTGRIEPPVRSVLYLHGIQSHGGWFLRSCDFLRQRHMAVLAPDRRGSGLNHADRGHCDSPGQLLEDLDACVQWLRAKTHCPRVDLVAVSWSGKLALVYAARHPEKVRSLSLVAPGLKARIDVGLAEKIRIGAEGLLHPGKRHEIPLNDPELFTANPERLRFIERDPLKLTEATASFFITSRRLDMKVPQAVAGLARWAESAESTGSVGSVGSVGRDRRAPAAIPVHLFLAEHDRIIDNEATIGLLRPILRPVAGSDPGPPARIYTGAHHTLDFEPAPQGFFADLADGIESQGLQDDTR